MTGPTIIRVFFASEQGGKLVEAEYDAKVTPKLVTLVRFIAGDRAATGYRTQFRGHVARSRGEALTNFSDHERRRAEMCESEARHAREMASEADARLKAILEGTTP